MTDSERLDVLFDVRVLEFTNAMNCHRCPGEAAYYLTEILIMWDDVGWDVEHMYLFN
jgi:hypothetical protein